MQPVRTPLPSTPPTRPDPPQRGPARSAEIDGIADRFPWRAFGLRGLRNQVLCVGVALLIWLISSGGRGNLFTAWVYSAAIGTCCWALMSLRYLFSRSVCVRNRHNRRIGVPEY